jgi:hypothetical protein
MEFKPWPSIPRMSKERAVVTEKIDGSNSAVRIRPYDGTEDDSQAVLHVTVDDEAYTLWAQSRKRLLQPGKSTDNFGFAGWVHDNASALVRTLGSGDHYGEWWGRGIQRGYGLSEKRFSLFNAPRWFETLHPTEARSEVDNLYIVPLLFAGQFYDLNVGELRKDLADNGSKAMPGFKSEGMVVYLREINASYKVLLENDDIHKWETQGA